MKRTTPKRKGRGPLAVRVALQNARRAAWQMTEDIEYAAKVVFTDPMEKLAAAAKALRTIANSSFADNRSRGLARAALKIIEK